MNLPEMKHLSEDQRERIVKKYELMADAYCSLLKAASSFIDSKSQGPVLQAEKSDELKDVAINSNNPYSRYYKKI